MADDPQLPLLGVILCCTSIPPEQRSDLASIAEQMGAAHKFDLTSDVTHLIVGDTDTPKYKFVAKERSDVKVLLPTWIEAVRTSWMQGGETDVGALESEYRLPVFTELRICVTGFEDLSYRKQLDDTINANGGEYRGNLTKDVTHLIAKEPSGQKYNYARQWGIKVVAVEWLEQSLERGMILDEGLYDPRLPVSDRGRGAWARRSASTSSLGKRAREKLLGPQNSRKLRRTASAKLNSQNDGLWTDIVGGETKQEEKNTDDWAHDDRESAEKENAVRGGKAAEDRDEKVEVETGSRTYKRKKSAVELGSSILSNAAQQGGIFRGKSFMLHGFDEKQESVLEWHLKSHGASIVSSLPELPPLPSTLHSDGGYILAPHNISIGSFRDSLETPQSIVTEFWVERCLFRKQLELPETSIINTPFRQFPIAGFEKLRICSTAFQGIDLLHLSKAVKVIGSEYKEFFDPNTSVLVCNSITPSHDKLLHAQLWSVPVVRADWLWESIGNGELLPFEAYLVQPIAATVAPGTDCKRLDEFTSAQRSDKKHGVPEARTKKLSKTSASLVEPYKELRKETPKIKSTKSARNTFPDDAGPIQILPDDDNLEFINEGPEHAHVGNETSKNHTISTSEPLRETSLNSSPPEPPLSPIKDLKPSPSPTKLPPSLTIPPSEEHSDTLGPAISSLLAAHRHSSTTTTTTTKPSTSDPPHPYRRRRELLGRAPSNLSSNSINLSRASSVDTVNTDGLGTPLESGPPRPVPSAVIYDTHDDQGEHEEPLQMTQLGYEDPDVAAWRKRVAYKMAGGKVSAKGGIPAPAKKDSGSNAAGLGIAKRTRQAVGGR